MGYNMVGKDVLRQLARALRRYFLFILMQYRPFSCFHAFVLAMHAKYMQTEKMLKADNRFEKLRGVEYVVNFLELLFQIKDH